MRYKYWKWSEFVLVADAVRESHVHDGVISHSKRRELASILNRTELSVVNMMYQIRGPFGYTKEVRTPHYQSKLIERYTIRYCQEKGIKYAYNTHLSTTQLVEPTIEKQEEQKPVISNGIEKRLQKLHTLYKEMEVTIVEVAEEIANYKSQKRIDAMQEEIKLAKQVVEAAKSQNLIETLKKKMFS